MDGDKPGAVAPVCLHVAGILSLPWARGRNVTDAYVISRLFRAPKPHLTTARQLGGPREPHERQLLTLPSPKAASPQTAHSGRLKGHVPKVST